MVNDIKTFAFQFYVILNGIKTKINGIEVKGMFQFYVILNGIKTLEYLYMSQDEFQFYVILNGIKTNPLSF